MDFVEEIRLFIKEYGTDFTEEIRPYAVVFSLNVRSKRVNVIALPIVSRTMAEALSQQREVENLMACLDGQVMIVPEDRWRLSGEQIRARLKSHFGTFTSIYARDCEVRRIEKPVAAAFLNANHSYGDASSRYRYGLFVRHLSPALRNEAENLPGLGDMVAVAEFSNARRWLKAGRTVASYEWVRYASLPDVRVNGGMGKMLEGFVGDVNPDDIMTYADLEWSEGEVYERLGFVKESKRKPVLFAVSTEDWRRVPVAWEGTDDYSSASGVRYYCNFGSMKFRKIFP